MIKLMVISILAQSIKYQVILKEKKTRILSLMTWRQKNLYTYLHPERKQAG